jgi:Short C-terminal domain
MVLSVSNISGRFGRERDSVIRITFSGLGTTTKRSIIFDVKNIKFVSVIIQQIKLLKDAEESPQLQKAIITKVYPQLCNKCLENELSFEFNSIGKLCLSCFEKEYGKMLLQPQRQTHKEEEIAHYNGGHKDHILAKKLGSKQSLPGKMYLTENYFIFAKEDKDLAKRWEIVIPLDSVISDRSSEEKERQKYTQWEGTSTNNFSFGSGFIHPLNKGVRLVIPYVDDDNGNFQEPEFILSSLLFSRIWAAELYKQVAKAKITMPQSGLSPDNRSESNNNDAIIQTTANCFNCSREFEIYNLTICKHCITSFCDICISNHSIDPALEVYAKYLGGHKLYPKLVDTMVYIFSDRIEIPTIHLRVPYTSMSNIENADEKKITAKRLFLVGSLAFGWKKRDIYTIIEYLDGFNQKQSLVFDFGKNIQNAQRRIYDRMLASHFAKDKLLEQKALENNTAKVQKPRMQENTTTVNRIGNLKPETASVDSHVSELPDVDKSRDNIDPLHILKVRFAKGEISKEQYEEMRRLLE